MPPVQFPQIGSLLSSVQLVFGQSCFARKGELLLVRYKDKKDVYVMTSKHIAGFSEKQRTVKERKHGITSNKKIALMKPMHIDHYNSKMGSVDATDQDMAS